MSPPHDSPTTPTQPAQPATPTPTPTPPTKTPLPHLKSKLQAAVRAREQNRIYATKSALIVYWKDDSTGAKEDAELLQETFKDCFAIDGILLGLGLGLRSGDGDGDEDEDEDTRLPELTVSRELERILGGHFVNRECDSPGRPRPTGSVKKSLLIFAYVGLGSVDARGELMLESGTGTGRSIPWKSLEGGVFEDSACCESVDVLGFFDCCYPEVTVTAEEARARERKGTGTGTMQILAAGVSRPGDVGLGLARSRSMHSPSTCTTFTKRFCDEIRLAFHTPQLPAISIQKISQALQDKKPPSSPTPTPSPNFAFLGGTGTGTRAIEIPLQIPPMADADIPVPSGSGSTQSASLPLPVASQDPEPEEHAEHHVVVRISHAGPGSGAARENEIQDLSWLLSRSLLRRRSLSMIDAYKKAKAESVVVLELRTDGMLQILCYAESMAIEKETRDKFSTVSLRRTE